MNIGFFQDVKLFDTTSPELSPITISAKFLTYMG